MKSEKHTHMGFRVTIRQWNQIELALSRKSKESGFDVNFSQFARQTIMEKVDKILTK